MQCAMVLFARKTLLRDSSDMLPSIKQLDAFALLPLLAFSMMPQLKHEAPTISKLDSSDNLMPGCQGKQRFSAKESVYKQIQAKSTCGAFSQCQISKNSSAIFLQKHSCFARLDCGATGPGEKRNKPTGQFSKDMRTIFTL